MISGFFRNITVFISEIKERLSMDKKEIYNPDGTLRAVIHFSGTKQELYPPNGSLIAVYDEATNETHTASGQLVGRGNLIMTCL